MPGTRKRARPSRRLVGPHLGRAGLADVGQRTLVSATVLRGLVCDPCATAPTDGQPFDGLADCRSAHCAIPYQMGMGRLDQAARI